MKSSSDSLYLRSTRKLTPEDFFHIYRTLRDYFGHQNWWPGDTPFEVIVGAILTQNTAWTNVEKAIRNMKQAQCLSPEKLTSIPEKTLADIIRPAGFFNIKAKRLKSFMAFLNQEFHGSLPPMFQCSGEVLREKLLGVAGIGPETADSILLYAAGKAFFVIDAYTQRVFSRHGIHMTKKMIRQSLKKGVSIKHASYHAWQRLFMDALEPDVGFYNDYHAQIVILAKKFCKASRPLCKICPLAVYL